MLAGGEPVDSPATCTRLLGSHFPIGCVQLPVALSHRDSSVPTVLPVQVAVQVDAFVQVAQFALAVAGGGLLHVFATMGAPAGACKHNSLAALEKV